MSKWTCLAKSPLTKPDVRLLKWVKRLIAASIEVARNASCEQGLVLTSRWFISSRSPAADIILSYAGCTVWFSRGFGLKRSLFKASKIEIRESLCIHAVREYLNTRIQEEMLTGKVPECRLKGRYEDPGTSGLAQSERRLPNSRC